MQATDTDLVGVPDVGGPTSRRLVVAPGIAVRRVAFDAPWDWLAAGWRDLWRTPAVSLGYGLAFAIVSAGLTVGLWSAGLQSLILALAGGFMLIGPLLAVGLYRISKKLETGEVATFSDIMASKRECMTRLGFFGVILLLVFMVWMQLAFLLFMLFSGGQGLPPPEEFVHMLLFTSNGLGLLVVGSAVGAALALFVFTISAVSVPLLMERDVDVVTAISTSANAVIHNPQALLLWAALVAGFMVLGILTLFAGLILAFPLVGHATWHAYRALVELTD